METSHDEAPTYLSGFISYYTPKYTLPLNTTLLNYFGVLDTAEGPSHFASVHATPFRAPFSYLSAEQSLICASTFTSKISLS